MSSENAARLTKVVRWGMIGCGDVTEVKSGPGFQKANGSQLVAVMRRVLAEYYGGRDNAFWDRPELWPGRS
jgi:hypothetical protein